LVSLTAKHGAKLLIDECYLDMVWEGRTYYSPVQHTLDDHVVVARGFSKVLGLQSWRMGYAVSSLSTIAILMKVSDPIYICVPLLQHALGKYLSGHIEEFQHLLF